MSRLLLISLFGAVAYAQPQPTAVQQLVKDGEAIFDKSCTAYCHGPKGATGGGAPRLAGRGFDEAYINTVVTNGIPHTAMPPFGTALPRRDVQAVVAYVATLNGLTPTAGGGRGGATAGPPPPALSAEAQKGRDLFGDSLRREARCSTCHEVSNIGIPVASPISKVPASAAALRALTTPGVSTLTMGGEAIPALVVNKGDNKVVFYDLAGPIPVLRTETPFAGQVTAGSTWKHSSLVAAYNDAELGSILTYLRGVYGPPPLAGGTPHYHHVHFNSMDPAAAIDFYAKRFNGERVRFGSEDALWTGKSFFLYNKVAAPPPMDVTAAIYHIGWSSSDIKAGYQHQLDIGTKFDTPLGDLAELLNQGTPGRGYYAYVDGPDHVLIEMNGGNSNNFGHVHLLSDDPVGASEWFTKTLLGVTRPGPAPSREVRVNKAGVQVGPAVFTSADGVLFAWFPTGATKALYPRQWAGKTGLESNKGHVIDHIAFSVDDLDATLERLKSDGVKITDQPQMIPGTTTRSAFIEGPDQLRIELLEGPVAAK